MSKIEKICVIGAGVMGAGIAAQIANSKTKVILLDIVSGAADSAKEKMLLGKMPQIAHKSLLEYVISGNLDDSLELIRECDWVIEVIVEKLEVKRALYDKIVPYMKPGAILSSNTSTLPMKDLRQSLPLQIQSSFLLTHFFNPPRQMQLVELIYDEKAYVASVDKISRFITDRLGKIIVKSNDTPGFIANRIGCFLLELCLKEVYEKKLSIVHVDNYFTKELGLPSTGIFGLFDLIGLDVMQMISTVLVNSLSKEDAFCKSYKKYDWYDKMLSEGYKGRKGLGGFYRMRDTNDGKVREVLDFSNMQYVEINKITEIDRKSLVESIDLIKNQFYEYVKSLLNIVSDSKKDIDTAIKLGYSWKNGPFEMMDMEIGPAKMHSSITNSDLGDKKRPILQNPSACLYIISAGVLVFELQTKMNTLDKNAFNLLIGSLDYAEKQKAEKLIIYNEGKNFSAGANLNLFLEMAKKRDVKAIEEILELGQKAMLRVKYSKVPVIACAKGVALGGGCELLLHAHKVCAHLDLTAGLVEIGVGLIPGWGGVTEMIMRAGGDNNKLIQNLRNIITQNKSNSAYWFADDYMLEDLEVVMHADQLLQSALESKFLSANLTKNSNMNSEFTYKIDLISACSDLKLDDHTIFIVKELQDRINSASLSEETVLKIEREIFKKLLFMPATLKKITKIV